MPHLFAVALLLVALCWPTPARSEPVSLLEQEPVLFCQSLEDAVGLLDLAEKHEIDAARKLFFRLNQSRASFCGIKTVGKVAAFEVVKKYPSIETWMNYQLEAWILRVEYADKSVLYIVMDRVVSTGRPI